MPFVLPLKTDRVDAGFQISMCAMKDQALASVGDLVGTVEEVQDVVRTAMVDMHSAEPLMQQKRCGSNATPLL